VMGPTVAAAGEREGCKEDYAAYVKMIMPIVLSVTRVEPWQTCIYSVIYLRYLRIFPLTSW
jgi:hypothetical protein